MNALNLLFDSCFTPFIYISCLEKRELQVRGFVKSQNWTSNRSSMSTSFHTVIPLDALYLQQYLRREYLYSYPNFQK